MKIININLFLIITLFACSKTATDRKQIDRLALVSRHNIVSNSVDTLNSLSVGNGEFAFTVDVTGLQTFYKEYENGIPLGTQTQWGWHKIPFDDNYSLNDVLVDYTSCDSSIAPYPVQHSTGKAEKATVALRANPHRLHLGIVGLIIVKSNGEPVKPSDLNKIKQTLNLWTGKIESSFEVEGVPVYVQTYCHQTNDEVGVSIESKLISQKRLSVEFSFPYGKDCHSCPGYDFDKPEKHTSTLTVSQNAATISRVLDSTNYFVNIGFSNGQINEIARHQFQLIPASDTFNFTVLFTKNKNEATDSYELVEKSSIDNWESFWSTGGAIDFSECTDTRAFELERRVVLSQYLTKVQCAGSLPPQETGLTYNSWFGKFHMEMYWWHGAHFPLWGRSPLLERSMQWYVNTLTKAQRTAMSQGYKGARWQKMTNPTGNESPSNVGAFIIWQQPHPIYLAELLYRNDTAGNVVSEYKEVVFNTATFMASFLKNRGGSYHLCHPLIPVQEIFDARTTDDPAYELQYWHYALEIAQQWRVRLSMKRNVEWDLIMKDLSPLPANDKYYLPVATVPEAYADNYRRDHPAVLAAYGFLPWNARVDTLKMANTLEEILREWHWESTWGWDFPMIAMTATRLNKPKLALEALLMDTPKNTYLKNGHNYQDKRLRLYLPGNGGLLAAVALMTAGWDGNSKSNPGFPDDGTWNVRWEGLKRMP